MASIISWLVILLISNAAFEQTTAENALTDDEINVLLANGFTVTKHVGNSTITIEHHGYPNHSFDGGWGNNPNTASMVNHSYNLPLEATVVSDVGCAGSLGVIGLAISGAAFYNPYTGFGWNAVEGECAETLDDCWGHPSPDGTYHYHRIPECLYTEPYEDKFLGVALDGYPIYGPMDSSGKTLTSADLDVCHGHTYNGRYMYRATFDFPYILSCFHGEKVNNVATNGNGQTSGNGQSSGSGNGQTSGNGQSSGSGNGHTSGNGQSGGNGQPPPPPPGRRRRDDASHVVNRRQVPAGLENDPCWNAEYANWDQLTCIVVCQNAGSDLSNCTSVSGNSACTSGATSFIWFLVAIHLHTSFF